MPTQLKQERPRLIGRTIKQAEAQIFAAPAWKPCVGGWDAADLLATPSTAVPESPIDAVWRPRCASPSPLSVSLDFSTPRSMASSGAPFWGEGLQLKLPTKNHRMPSPLRDGLFGFGRDAGSAHSNFWGEGGGRGGMGGGS